LKNKLEESLSGVSYTELWEPLKGSFGNVIKAISLAAKDIWGSLAYAFKLTFTFNEEKIKEIKTNRQQALNNIASEYEGLWKNVVNANPDMSTLAMIAAPGPYFAAYITLNGRSTALGIQNFIKDAGVGSGWFDKFLGLGGGKERRDKAEDLELLWMRRDSSGAQSSALQRKLDSVITKLEKIFQMQSSQREGIELVRSMLLEKDNEKSSSPLDVLSKGIIDATNSEEFKKIMDKRVDINKIVSAKEEQLKSYEAALNAPFEFYRAIKQSKNIEQTVAAYKLLENSFLKIEGIDFDNVQSQLADLASKNYEKIKKDEKASKEVLKAAGISIDFSKLGEEDKKKILMSALIKIQSIKELQNIQEHVSSPEFKKILDEAKSDLLKDFLDGISEKELDQMKSVDSSNPYISLLSSGVERIKKAGLQN
jgi:hypothetical protein